MSEAPPGEHGLQRVGVIALSPGYRSVALVKYPDSEGWQFPSQPIRRGMSPEHTAVEAAVTQLGLAVQDTLCLDPMLHALGPLPGQSTKFLLAFNVAESELAPSREAPVVPTEASWQDLQQLLQETEGQAVIGNQLVAVLKQLQQLFKRLPDVAGFLGQQADLAEGMFWQDQPGTWQGPTPKDYLASWCKQQKLPLPCYNVFEQGKSAAKTHFCVTCILPHAGLQLTPDAVYRTPVEAIQNAALLAALYLEGAIKADNPLVHFAPAGNMAKVPHGHLTVAEVEEVEGGDAERARGQRERDLQQRASNLQRQIAAMQRQPELVLPGQLDGLAAELAETQRALELSRPQRGPGGQLAARSERGAGAPERRPPPEKASRPAPFPPGVSPPPKRPRVAISLQQALAAIPHQKNPVQAVKEVCDKCRWAQPRYTEQPRGGLWLAAASLPEAGLAGPVEGAMHADKRQAKLLAAETLLGFLKQKAGSMPAS